MKFEVKMTSTILYNYLLRQYYQSFTAWIGIALGIALIVFYFLQPSIWYIVAGVIMIFSPPFSLFAKSKRQMLLNPAFKKPIHYHIDDEGINVSQGDNTVSVLWEQLFRVVSTKTSFIVFTSPVNAWIWPYQSLSDNTERIKNIMKQKLPAGKIKKL